VVIEATGSPRAGIANAKGAIAAGKHIVMVNVESDVLAGPVLARKANSAGVCYSMAYGDQPALVSEMVDWARATGFHVTAAGKGTKYLPAYHAVTPDDVWTRYGLTPEEARRAGMKPQMFNSFLDGTKSAIEMVAIANACGLDVPDDGLAFLPFHVIHDAKTSCCIVVYKIDRLTRSLADFAKLVERLDQAEASFVSVTQSFNMATSMGRLTLNVLLSFAQFEREVTAERIRDKIAASKRKGLWMGDNAPLGYQADGRTLKIDADEASTIKTLYDLYLENGFIRVVKEHVEDLGLRSRRRIRGAGQVSGGKPFDRGHIHHLLSNPIHAGRIRHKGQVFESQHPAIIEPYVWDRVQQMLEGGAAKSRGTKQIARRSPLAGKLFDETGDRLNSSQSRKNGRRHPHRTKRHLLPSGSPVQQNVNFRRVGGALQYSEIALGQHCPGGIDNDLLCDTSEPAPD
jgi:hypothetical protein